MKKVTIVLGLLAIISLALLVTTIKNTMADDTQNIIVVQLEDSLTVTDTIEATTNFISVTGAECWKRSLYNQPCTILSQLFVSPNIETPHPLIGKIISNKDGTCWMIEEKLNTLYYKLIGDCPNA